MRRIILYLVCLVLLCGCGLGRGSVVFWEEVDVCCDGCHSRSGWYGPGCGSGVWHSWGDDGRYREGFWLGDFKLWESDSCSTGVSGERGLIRRKR